MFKMSKLFLVVMLCLSMTLLFGGQRAKAGDLLTYISKNTTAVRTDTAVSSTTIIKGKHKILGFRISPNDANCVDPTVELYDAATTGAMSSSTQFDGLEADTSPLRSDGDWYPKPKKLSNGLAIKQGGYTTVVIFYERFIQ